MTLREAIKRAAHVSATVIVAPWLVSFLLRSIWLGRNRALEGSTQALGLIPGLTGQYLRRAFLARVLTACDRSATIEFGTLFSQTGAQIDRNVYIGPRCHLGLVHLESDVLMGGAVHVPSGAQTHGVDDLSRPIREQAGERRLVRIGSATWVGSGAIIMANVGRDCVIGAGAVVTKPLVDGVVAGGVPARVIRRRDGRAASSSH